MRVITDLPRVCFPRPRRWDWLTTGEWGIFFGWLILSILLLTSGCSTVGRTVIPDYDAKRKVGVGEPVPPGLLVKVVPHYACLSGKTAEGFEYGVLRVIVVVRGMEPGPLFVSDNGVEATLQPAPSYNGVVTAGEGRHDFIIRMGELEYRRTSFVVRCDGGK